MISRLGLAAAGLAAAVFLAAYGYGARAGASWLDRQYLFLLAAPYNATMLRLTGEARFDPDKVAELLKAVAFNMALAFLAGALVGFVLRAVWRLGRRGARRFRRTASRA